MNPRTIEARNPPRVIVAAALIGLFVGGFVLLATWQSGAEIEKAKMRGRIVAKEFVPQPEHRITVGRKGGVDAEDFQGEYILTVEVPTKDGERKPYHVWVDKQRYNALKIGDSFDVGPYLVRQ
jgi:hypothetical protein